MKYEFAVGDAVKPLAGRNLQQIYIILRLEGDYAYLANGIDRLVENPKKKRIKHIRLLLSAAVCESQLGSNGDANAMLHNIVANIKSNKETICQKKT